MPTYEYECDACGRRFEKFQSITAAPIKICPVCKKHKVRRLISGGAGLIFKGSGFYITDYRSEGYKSAAKAEAGSSSSTDTKPADSKSASKTDSTPAAAKADSTPSKSKSKSS